MQVFQKYDLFDLLQLEDSRILLNCRYHGHGKLCLTFMID